MSSTLPSQPQPATDIQSVTPNSGPASSNAQRTDPWARIAADPGHSPEVLALAAVQTIGPRAAEWADRTRAAYPTADADGLARLAVAQFSRFSSVHSVFAAVAGPYAPFALFGVAALTHAELSLHVAAAYGVDPADSARAVDLLVIAQVHPSRSDAEVAVAAALHNGRGGGLTDAVWRLGRMLAAQTGGWAALRVANRFLPGASLLGAVLAHRATAQTIGARATHYFRSAGAR
ncbi:hypothetical protein [Actinoplanes sp. NPDC051859]|uniref:hypothetical protein n=1 Tax=Actinoplanes sp. NPDC051859 TaxID=3363909 RepID=UPI0037BC5429